MVNQEKIKVLGLYEKAVKKYPDDCCPDSEQVHALRMGYQVGAIEMNRLKDQQFKEYLEKRRNKVAEIDTKDYKGWEMYYMADITEIINELFGETEQDNSDREE